MSRRVLAGMVYTKTYRDNRITKVFYITKRFKTHVRALGISEDVYSGPFKLAEASHELEKTGSNLITQTYQRCLF